MKRKSLFSLLCILSVAIYFTACKKNDDSATTPDPGAQITAHAGDEAQVASELDAVSLDASTVVEYDPSFSGNNSVVDQIICDASVTYNAETDPMTITITYNGSNCGAGRTRTGAVVLSMPKSQKWKDEGATITVNFQELKVTRTSDNKSVTLSGTQTHTNVSGGLLVMLPNLGTITHSITSDNMSVSFDNGTARTWHISKQHVFTYSNGVVITITGTHAEGNETGIAEWGENRFGNNFTTTISSPLVIKQDCNFRITGGAVTHTAAAHTAVVTFGLDATGAEATCPGEGHFYYKLVLTGGNGNSLNLILPY